MQYSIMCLCFFIRDGITVSIVMQLLFGCSNVYFDISSVADNQTISEDMSVKIKSLIEVVPERVLFGSDYSGCSQMAYVEFVRKLELSEEGETKVLYGNAIQVYAIKE